MTARRLKAPIYTLPHGIEVVGEYAPSGKNPYWRLRIRLHHFFPNVVPRNGGIYVRRSRVLLAAKLGRALTVDELAHHADEDKQHDTAENLEVTSQAEHTRHHKTGTKHRPESRAKVSETLRRIYASGQRARPTINKRDALGRIAA